MGTWPPVEPRWHRTVRTLFTVAFFTVWLEALGCFAYFQMLARTASPVATPELPVPVVNHSQVFYVTARQNWLYHHLLTAMAIGIPTIIVSGVVLHSLVGVRIFDRR